MKKTAVSPFSLIAKFSRASKLWQQLDSKPRKFGTETDLSGSDIRLIEVVGQNEGLSVTDLAKRLGITKGAVSQTLKRSEAKEIIVKKVDPTNSSRITVGLSTKGKVAYYSYLQWQRPWMVASAITLSIYPTTRSDFWGSFFRFWSSS